MNLAQHAGAMGKIFVAIASYRDTECQWTVKDLFAAAADPTRIAVGICWQFDPAQDAACFSEPYPRPAQVRVIDVALADARGACWAKAKALSLLADEDYVLLIDSHMRFAKGWDEQLIAMLAGIGEPRAFLSTYPAGYEPPDKRSLATPRIAPVKFFDRILSQNSLLLDMPEPLPSYLVAGGYIFGHRAMFDEVPYDPHIYFIGEEIAHAARYYTHGWLGYTPNKCLIHHYYARKTSIKHWEDGKDTWPRLNLISYKRVRHLLDIERTSDSESLVEIDRYGLGKEKTLVEFQLAIGVNFNAQVIDRNRQTSVANVLASQSNPKPVTSTHEIGNLGTYACRHGHFLLPLRDTYIGKSLIQYGEWADQLNLLFAELVVPGSRVLEVGSGFGAHTVPLSRLAGYEGTVIAIEQSRKMVELAYANIALNALENVQIIHARAGAVDGVAAINEPSFSREGNFGYITHRDTPDGTARLVPALTIDTQSPERIRFAFIDTPGGVSRVIAGAVSTLESFAPSLVVNADNPEDARDTARALLALGYKIWWSFSPYFSRDNFFKNPNNVFGALMSTCLVAVPDNRDLSYLKLVRAIGPATDSIIALEIWKRLVE